MPTITFTRPFDLSEIRRQGAVAYAAIYVGRLHGGSAPAPPTPTKGGKKKTRPKKFKKIGEVPYRLMSSCRIKDKTKGLDEATFKFSNVELSEGEPLLDLFLEGEALEIVFGVRGLWHFRRRMMVRDVEYEASNQINITVNAQGSGARLVDREESKTFINRRVSQIVEEIARDAGMRAIVTVKDDPVIPQLSSGRRSAMEVIYHLAGKYGYFARVVNDVVYLDEFNGKGQPVRRYDFAGPRGNMLSYKGKSTIAGIRGTTTKAKNREDKGNASTKAKETAPSRSLRIEFKDRGPAYTTKTVVRRNAKPTKPQDGSPTDKQKRTVHTLRRGTAASRVAKGKNITRTLRTKKATFVTINEPLVPNINILIENLNTKYNGRYCTHDVTFEFRGGIWVVSCEISKANGDSRAAGKVGRNKVRKKGDKAPDKKKRKASPNPKLVVTYKRSGAYAVKRTGTGVGNRALR